MKTYCGKCGENVVYLSAMVSIVNTFAARKKFEPQICRLQTHDDDEEK